jgi:hypothetical protein
MFAIQNQMLKKVKLIFDLNITLHLAQSQINIKKLFYSFLILI